MAGLAFGGTPRMAYRSGGGAGVLMDVSQRRISTMRVVISAVRVVVLAVA